jgi:hypothetical protein
MFSWLEEEMSREAEELFNLLYTKEYDKDVLRKELNTGRFRPEDVNRAAIDYVLGAEESNENSGAENSAAAEEEELWSRIQPILDRAQ